MHLGLAPERGGVKQWLLSSRVGDDKKKAIAQSMTDYLYKALGADMYPDEDCELVFGIKMQTHPLGPTVAQFSIGALMFNCWSTLYKYAPYVHKKSICAALTSGTLPQAFKEWVMRMDCEGYDFPGVGKGKCGNCEELVKRNMWDRIPWDHEIHHVLSCHDLECAAPSGARRMVWINPPANDDPDGPAYAAKEGLLVECFGDPSSFLLEGWVRYKCTLLQSLGEGVVLFAEGSSKYKNRNEPPNIAAAYMTCDADTGLTHHVIRGRALLLRESGCDLDVETVKKLCCFVDDMMDIWSEGHSTAGLQCALKQARANWPRYTTGNKLKPDGSLRFGSCAVQRDDHTCEQFQPPPAEGNPVRTQHGDPKASSSTETMILLRFSRDPEALHNRLQHDEKLEDIRIDLSSNNMSLRMNNGAYVFVPSYLHGAVKEHISNEGTELGPNYVVVTAEWEQRIMRVVHSMPRKYKVSVKGREESQLHHVSKGTRINIIVSRTFLEVKIASSLFSGPSGGPRTASTTEADPRKGQNPRGAVKR